MLFGGGNDCCCFVGGIGVEFFWLQTNFESKQAGAELCQAQQSLSLAWM